MNAPLPIDRVEAARAYCSDELRFVDLNVLESVAKAATWGPWQVIEERITGKDGNPLPDHGMFKPLKRRIFTVWDHGQLKGPMGVVNESHVLDARDTSTVHIDPKDAAFIAAADPQTVLGLIAEVRRLRAADPTQPALQEARQTIAATREAFCMVVKDPSKPLEVLAVETVNELRDAQEAAAATNNAYWERNRLVALVSKLFPASIEQDPKETADWPVIIIDLPSGQVSWHVPALMLPLFKHLPRGVRTWDGHDFHVKYDRVDDITPDAASPALVAAAHALADEYCPTGEPQWLHESGWAHVEPKWRALVAALPSKASP